MPDHPVVYFEIGCFDKQKTRDFFSQLFGWDITDQGVGMSVETGSIGSLGGQIVELAPEWGPYVTVYVQVDDVEGCLAKAGELGGKTLVGPREIPGQGSFAWLAAPEGNIIGIWKAA